ncbi:hypothetical protein D3C72_1197100 [compost metagenome]
MREIGADAHRVFADQVDDIADGLDIVVHGGLHATLEKGRKHRHADEATALCNKAQLRVALVARVLFQPGRQAVRIAHGFGRSQDRLFGRCGAYVGQVHHDANPVHLGDDFAAVAGQAAVAFVASRADQVLGVVAKLNHAHPHVGKGFDRAQVVLECVAVLKAQDDARLAVALGLADIFGGAHQGHQVFIGANQRFHGGDVGDGLFEPFPYRHRAVGGRQPAPLHVFEHGPVPFRDDQAVDNHTFLMKRSHAVPPRERCRSVDGMALAERLDLGSDASLGGFVLVRAGGQHVDHMDDHFPDGAKFVLAEPARRGGRRAQADAGGH